MIDTLKLIEKHYVKGTTLYNILIEHSIQVRDKAIAIANQHPELNIDKEFVEEAAMLHDIGIYLTNAPDIHCVGSHPYLCHGYLGRELLDKEGLFQHALVCERHTGVGLTAEYIKEKSLPLPIRDLIPETIEEQVICFADCFYSKTKLGKEKEVDEVRRNIARFSKEGDIARFDFWCSLFL